MLLVYKAMPSEFHRWNFGLLAYFAASSIANLKPTLCTR